MLEQSYEEYGASSSCSGLPLERQALVEERTPVFCCDNRNMPLREWVIEFASTSQWTLRFPVRSIFMGVYQSKAPTGPERSVLRGGGSAASLKSLSVGLLLSLGCVEPSPSTVVPSLSAVSPTLLRLLLVGCWARRGFSLGGDSVSSNQQCRWRSGLTGPC